MPVGDYCYWSVRFLFEKDFVGVIGYKGRVEDTLFIKFVCCKTHVCECLFVFVGWFLYKFWYNWWVIGVCWFSAHIVVVVGLGYSHSSQIRRIFICFLLATIVTVINAVFECLFWVCITYIKYFIHSQCVPNPMWVYFVVCAWIARLAIAFLYI